MHSTQRHRPYTPCASTPINTAQQRHHLTNMQCIANHFEGGNIWTLLQDFKPRLAQKRRWSYCCLCFGLGSVAAHGVTICDHQREIANYPERVLRSVLEHMYDISSCIVKNTFWGKACSCTRRFTIMTLRRVVAFGRPISMLQETFRCNIGAYSSEDCRCVFNVEIHNQIQN